MNIVIQPLSKKEIDLLYQWLCKPLIAERWGGAPASMEAHQEKYERYLTSDYVFPYMVYLNHEPIGFVQIYYASRVGKGWWPDADTKTIGLDMLIGEEHLHNKGYGTLILKQFIEQYCRNKLGVNKIIMDVAPDNLQAQRCYEKVGFQNEGDITTPNGKALLFEYHLS